MNGGNYELDDLRKLRDLVDERMEITGCVESAVTKVLLRGFWKVVRRRGRFTTRTRKASRTLTCSIQSVTKAPDPPGKVALLKRSSEVFTRHSESSLLILTPSCRGLLVVVKVFPIWKA